MAREKACPHNAKSLNALATELVVIADTIREIANSYDEKSLKSPILVDNQTSIVRALLELNKLKNKAKSQLEDKLDEKRITSMSNRGTNFAG